MKSVRRYPLIIFCYNDTNEQTCSRRVCQSPAETQGSRLAIGLFHLKNKGVGRQKNSKLVQQNQSSALHKTYTHMRVRTFTNPSVLYMSYNSVLHLCSFSYVTPVIIFHLKNKGVGPQKISKLVQQNQSSALHKT